jgi:L,D-peptidoglycan transpeptidase YkuD (ErfK/YbiS/YcfS/YnhG family)
MALITFTTPLFALVGFLCAGGLLAGWAEPPGPLEAHTARTGSLPMNHSFTAIPGHTGQLILAVGESDADTNVRVYLLERKDASWHLSAGPIPAVIGRGGFAGPGKKREGDGKTPSGVYPLELAFGYGKEPVTKMTYRQATEKDVWVDDETSPDYNRWVKRDETTASSFEEMKRRDGFYRYGLVIGYNTRPVVRGHGSAIFIHLWKKPGAATSGCLAMAEKDLLHVMGWLDPEQNPRVVLGTEAIVSTLVK